MLSRHGRDTEGFIYRTHSRHLLRSHISSYISEVSIHNSYTAEQCCQPLLFSTSHPLTKPHQLFPTSENQTSFQQSEPLHHLFQYVSTAINEVIVPLDQVFSRPTTSFPVNVDHVGSSRRLMLQTSTSPPPSASPTFFGCPAKHRLELHDKYVPRSFPFSLTTPSHHHAQHHGPTTRKTCAMASPSITSHLTPTSALLSTASATYRGRLLVNHLAERRIHLSLATTSPPSFYQLTAATGREPFKTQHQLHLTELQARAPHLHRMSCTSSHKPSGIRQPHESAPQELL